MTEKAMKAFCDYNRSMEGYGHPLSMTVPGVGACTQLESAREKIANCLGSDKAGNIVFTSNCTQACEWAVKILNTNASKVKMSRGEHSAVFLSYEKWIGEQQFLDDQEEYDAAICIKVQNETGLINDLDPYIKGSCLLFSDMSQALGKIDIDLDGVDIAAFGGHKFGGANLGFLYLNDPVLCEELNAGSRYFLDAPGTPNVAAAIATSVALEEAVKTLKERQERMVAFQSALEAYLQEKKIDIIHHDKPRSPNTTFIHFPRAIRLIHSLSSKGIYVGMGSACGALHEGVSPFMKHLGFKDASPQDFLRISQFGSYDGEDAKMFIDLFDKSIREVV